MTRTAECYRLRAKPTRTVSGLTMMFVLFLSYTALFFGTLGLAQKFRPAILKLRADGTLRVRFSRREEKLPKNRVQTVKFL